MSAREFRTAAAAAAMSGVFRAGTSAAAAAMIAVSQMEESGDSSHH
jgi:hypothetical protein